MGKLFIFSAPSGAGKTTIVKELLNIFPFLEFSISATNREMRCGEKNGKDYYFISTEMFSEKIINKEFLEWEEVYPNQYYGTLKAELERIWSKGNHIIFDVDVIGGLNIKNAYPQNSLSVFIMPPSMEILAERLKNRSTENEESIKKRLNKTQYEMSFSEKFDVILVNDNLPKVIEKAKNLIQNFILK